MNVSSRPSVSICVADEDLDPMESPRGYTLAEVLAVAKIHPFYSSEITYPPNDDAIRTTRDQVKGKVTSSVELSNQPLLRKEELYKVIQRLKEDLAPGNTFRRSIYTSITGGGGSSTPLFFPTDAAENRRQRAGFGRLLRTLGVVKDTDWVITVHQSGGLYRSLDLTLELLENAGATALAVGHALPLSEVIRLAQDYRVNVLSGDSSQIIQLAHYISTLEEQARHGLNINKIIYTSETLNPGQRAYILSVLGSVEICSFLGSAEAGPYGVSAPHLIENGSSTALQDFVFDTRQTLIEILPYENGEVSETISTREAGCENGPIAQTSLTRLRNPLVRYLTGDIGSVHDLPLSAKSHVSDEDWPHLRILRLQGRDTRFSFEWDGEYIEFQQINILVNQAQHGVLQWQLVLENDILTANSCVNIRILSSKSHPGEGSEVKEMLKSQLGALMKVGKDNESRFKIVIVNDLKSFVRSGTGGKVPRFVDQFNT